MDRIVGIGNALLDIILKLDNDNILQDFNLPKGGMELIDSSLRKKILDNTEGLEKQISSGGSAANTIHGLSNLGIDTGFIGSVGKDDMGKYFINDLKNNGVKPGVYIRDSVTGTALTLLSKDSERTFATYLGAAIELSAENITEEILRDYTFCHIEGYLVMDHNLIKKIASTAKNLGLKVSIDLASYNVVEANLDFLHNLIKNYVDIVFANEDEARAFTGQEPKKALEIISQYCEIAVVKTGKKGSMVKSEKKFCKVDSLNVNCIDTTGAGDLYAAGFLYGLINSFDIKKCANTGTLLAANVIQNIGAKINNTQWSQIKSNI